MSETSVNDKSAVIAAVCISFIAVAGFLILPLFVGAVAGDMELTERQIGFLASSVLAGSAISAIFAIFWVRRIDWHRAAFVALGTLFLAHCASMLVDDFQLFLVLQFIGGLAGGAAYSLALTVLSDNQNSGRCFGFSIAAQVLFQVLGLLLMPLMIESQGLNSVLLVLAGLAFLGLVVLNWLPRRGVEIKNVPILCCF